MHLGPEELLVAAKIAVAPPTPAAEVAGAIDAAEAAIRAVEPIAARDLPRARHPAAPSRLTSGAPSGRGSDVVP